MLGVGVVFVLAARRSGSRIHLVTAGASILIGHSPPNAELVVDAVGAPAALLVEGVILLGVAGLGWAAGQLITGSGWPRATSGDGVGAGLRPAAPRLGCQLTRRPPAPDAMPIGTVGTARSTKQVP